MSDYDDDYGYDDYDDYDGGYDDGGYDDGGYDDGGYDYGDYDHGGYEDHGAHDHDSHDAGEDAVAVEYTGFAVIEEVEGGHDHGSAVDGGGHEDHTGYAEYAHSDDGYQSDHDQALSYGVISGGPSYVQDHDDYPASYSPSQYAPSARGASQPSSAPRGLMVDSQSHGGSYSHRPSSRSSGVHYNGNYHGPGTWNYEEQSLRNHSAGYRLETHYPPSNAATSHRNGYGGKHMSDYEYLQAWGGRHNFMASYGLKPEPNGYEESQAIMTALRDRESRGYGSSYHSASAMVQPSPAHHDAAPAGASGSPYYQDRRYWW